MKKSTILALALSCAMAFPLATTTSDSIKHEILASAEDTINNMSVDEYDSQVKNMILLVNQYRAENGLEPYKVSPKLMEFAKLRASEQETTGTSHTRPDGSNWPTIFSENGVKYSLIQENVGGGTQSSASDCNVMLNQWKQSEGHNANLLGECEYIGVGVDYYDGRCYWVQLFCSSTDEKITDGAYTITAEPNVTTTTEPTVAIPDENYDVNKDGTVNVIDLILLKKYLLSMNV